MVGGQGEVDGRSIATKGFAAASDIDRLRIANHITDFVHATFAGEEASVVLFGECQTANATGENTGRSVVPVAFLSDVPTEKALLSGNEEIGNTLKCYHCHIVNSSEVSVEVSSRSRAVNLGESSLGIGFLAVEQEKTTTQSRHFVQIGTLRISALASCYHNNTIIEFQQLADRKGNLFAIHIARNVVPNIFFLVSTGIETASCGTSIQYTVVVELLLHHQRGDATTDIIGANFYEIVALKICLLSSCCARNTDTDAHK